MIAAGAFVAAARASQLTFFAGVPCSFLTPLLNRVISEPALCYVGAASEGEAVAIAAGAWLAGRRTAVLCQNSGLGNAVNPLVSLNFPFRIPTLMVVTWRGQPGLKDEPQHELMGQITGSMLDVMRIPHRVFPQAEADLAPALDGALQEMERSGLPYAMVMPKDTMPDEPLVEPARASSAPGTRSDLRRHGQRPSRYASLERVLAVVPPQAALIATTGKCGRELFTIADREQHLYQVGSMGCASGMGLGVALNAARPVVVLDGDGAALMKMGTLATIGAYRPASLIHLLLDNATHDSTGGQATVSPSVDFAAVALACGYATGASADDLEGLEKALRAALAAPGPHMIHLRIAPGSRDKLGRPTVSPREVAQRFRAFLARSAA